MFDLADGYPGQHQPGISMVHRCPAGVKFVAALSLSMGALFARDWWSVGALVGVHVGLYLLAGLGVACLWRDVRALLLQFPLVLALYLLRSDPVAALDRAGIVSLQIALALLPTLVLQRTTRPDQLMRGLRLVIPQRLAFVLFTSLRFLPLVMREAKSIYLHQILRGARIAPRQLVDPRNWPDLVHCLILPLIIRVLAMARDAAVAAASRGMGARDAGDDEGGPSDERPAHD